MTRFRTHLKDSVAADGEEDVLLELLVLWELLHGVQVDTDDVRQYARVEILTKLTLAEVEEASCRCHLNIKHRLILVGRLDNEL